MIAGESQELCMQSVNTKLWSIQYINILLINFIINLASIMLINLMFIILAFAYSLPVVLLAAVFYGVGFGTLQPIMNAIVIKLSPPERRGAANATYYVTMDISFGLGSLIWGAVSQYFGFTTVFLACATSVAISLVMYYLLLHPLVRNTC